jgi:hypothetical protein
MDREASRPYSQYSNYANRWILDMLIPNDGAFRDSQLSGLKEYDFSKAMILCLRGIIK